MLHNKCELSSRVEGLVLTFALTSAGVAGAWLVIANRPSAATIEHAAPSWGNMLLFGAGLALIAAVIFAVVARRSGRSLNGRQTIAQCEPSNVKTTAAAQARDFGQRVEDLRHEREASCLSSRALHEVLGVIGHELRTPFAGLHALIEFILTEPDRNTAQVEAFLRSMNDEILRCSEMVNNMLEAARLESGMARWSWRRVQMERVCAGALSIVEPLARSKDVDFKCCVVPKICSMRGDADAIRRLILNLLSNAVRHTKEGEIAVEVREASGPDHDWVQIRVRDTGNGISPDLAQSLGRPFAANSGSVGSQYLKGAGLGLAICNEIAFAHGGRITVASAPKSGTTFTVLLRADLDRPITGERTEEPIPLVTAA